MYVCVDEVQDPRHVVDGGHFPDSGVKGNVVVLRAKFRNATKNGTQLHCALIVKFYL